MNTWDQLCRNENARITHFYNGTILLGTMIYGIGENDDDLVPVGVTIVSPKDVGNKERGRKIAFGRFLKAKYHDPTIVNLEAKRVKKHLLLFGEPQNIPMRGIVPLNSIREIIQNFRSANPAGFTFAREEQV